MKKLLLLGAGGGIGSAIKNCFENKGYKVISPSSKELDLNNLPAISQYLNNLDLKDCSSMIYCAGINNPKEIESQPLSEYIRTLNINCLGFVEIVKHLAPIFKQNKEGNILAITSVYGIISREGRSAYSISKHALLGAVQAMALEFGAFNVKVNALAPGFVATKLTTKNNTPKQIKDIESKIALGRLASPEEIANVAYFLGGEENTYITGQTIIADGGFLVGGYRK